MGYCKHGCVGELRAYCVLDECVGGHIDRRRRLVENENTRLSQQCTRQANELALTDTVKTFSSRKC
jgi:hypothetical protein